MDQVEDKGFIPAEFVESETKWFYNELGWQDSSSAGLRTSNNHRYRRHVLFD